MKRMLLAAAGLGALLGLGAIVAAQDPGSPPPMGGKMMRGGMDKMLERRFVDMDTNHDGVVTRPEYDAYRAKMRVDREARMKDHRDQQFARMDRNRDGTLSRQEFDPPPPPPPPAAGGNAPLGYDPAGGAPPPPPPGGDMGPPPGGPHGMRGERAGGMAGDWFDRADTNHDGKVTLGEAKAAMRMMMSERRGMRGPGGPGGPGGDMPPPPPPPQQ